MSDQYLVGSEVQWLWQQNSSGAAELLVVTNLVMTLDWQHQRAAVATVTAGQETVAPKTAGNLKRP